VLLQFLCAFGNACGRHSYMQVEADRHPPQIWPVIVGETAKGRKGPAWGRTRGRNSGGGSRVGASHRGSAQGLSCSRIRQTRR
jgi:hypothetical protein